MEFRKYFLRGSALILILILIFGISYSVLVYISNKPPIDEINFARKTIASAKNNMAGRYATETLRAAEGLYHQSVEEWQLQNKKFFLFRNYEHTLELAIESYNMAASARDEALDTHSELSEAVKKQMLDLKIRVSRFDKYYKNLPLNSSTVNKSSNGETAFLEAQVELKKGQFVQAQKLLKKASENLSKAENEAHFKLTNFYNDYPLWQENVQKALSLSKKGQTVILIDKLDASCTVLKSGKEYKIFPAEFGTSWMGDKTKTGDKATPEGIYKVTQKKNSSKTKYHKALLINYPNNDDKKRFETLVKSGQIPKNSNIGGMIEIHGDGGKGVNWTDGCIALENTEMDLLYSLCSVNTPVIIVGARQSLDEYLD